MNGEGIYRSRFILDFGWQTWLKPSGFPLSRKCRVRKRECRGNRERRGRGSAAAVPAVLESVRQFGSRRQPPEREVDHRYPNPRLRSFSQTFVVLAHRAMPAQPRQRPLHPPALGKNRESAFAIRFAFGWGIYARGRPRCRVSPPMICAGGFCRRPRRPLARGFTRDCPEIPPRTGRPLGATRPWGLRSTPRFRSRPGR